MAQQLSFDLPGRTALGRDDFFVSPSNAPAVAMVESWQSWPARKLLLLGPTGSGKTHLTHVWAAMSDAQILAADAVAHADIPALSQGPLAVEDCHKIAGHPAGEEALFHLHNLVLAEGNPLLMTGTGSPASWPLKLADIASRLLGTPSVHIRAPDDALLGAVLNKLFNDKQLSPSPATIPYLIKRIDRSFSAAKQIVEAIDTYSLENKRPITSHLASEVLDKITN